MTRTCARPGCGIEFEPTPRSSNQMYCSAECNNEAYNARRKDERAENATQRACACGCGRTFLLTSPHRLYYSRNCTLRAWRARNAVDLRARRHETYMRQKSLHPVKPRKRRSSPRDTPAHIEDSMTYESYTRAVLEQIT
jgi:hypothetical protein